MEKISDKFYNWASILEWDTREQVRQLSTMPFIYPHVALMPDAHLGKGCAVGSVIPTVGAIIPAAVGVDIGCGMIAKQTQFKSYDLTQKKLVKLHAAISAAVPLSAGNYNAEHITRTSAAKRIQELDNTPGSRNAWRVSDRNPWTRQLGSLGSGNHFIEISVDEDDNVWFFLHSGSRGVGNRLATEHIAVAKDVCKGEKLPNQDLAYLTEGTEEFEYYIEDLRWAQKFALLNREEMMDRVTEAFEETFQFTVRQIGDTVNCHHNYTEKVLYGGEHPGNYIWLSRKGAINAEKGRPGLIPGSMGDKSYVVSGLGNPESLWSAPHGAGRMLSRSKAKDKFDIEDLTKRMGKVVWGNQVANGKAFLDEHPLAYKAIDVVMEDARDLVEIKHTLKQIVNVKGN